MAKYTVSSPDGKQYEVTGPAGASQQEVLQAVFDQLGIKPPEPERPERTLTQEATAGFRRGKERLKSALGDVLPAMGASALGFEDYAKRQMEEAAETERQISEYNPPSYRSYKDVEGLGSGLGYISETLGESAPDILASLVPGGIGGAAARRLGTAGLRELGAAGAEQIARRGAMGEAAGVYLGSYAQNAPEIFQNIYQETGQLEPGVSALFGSVNAALDSVLPASILRSMSQPVRVGVVEKILERSGMEPSLLRKVVAQAPANVAREGLTEGGQEAIGLVAEDFVKNTEHIWGSKEWERIVDASIRGGIAGGAFGVPGSVAERVRERAEEPAKLGEDIAAEEERLAQEIPPPAEPVMSTKLARDDLLQAGLKPQSGYIRQLANKDLSIPEDVAQIDATLAKMRQNPKMDPEVLASVESVVEAFRPQPVEEAVTETPTPALFSRTPKTTPVKTYKTADGYTFYELPTGEVVDNLNPNLVDVSWPSREQFLEDSEGTAYEVSDELGKRRAAIESTGSAKPIPERLATFFPDDAQAQFLRARNKQLAEQEAKVRRSKMRLVSDEDTSTKSLFSAERKKTKERIPELEELAQGVIEGRVTKEQYDEGVKAFKPVTPYTDIPAPATSADLERSLSTDKRERIYSPREELEEGYPVGLRLDIPAYTNHGVWAISVHEQQKNFNAGKSIGYDSVAAITEPTFGAVEKAALSIAAGKAKSTIAVVKGNWKPVTEKEAVAQAKAALKDKSWTQVGMDPTRHAYFYDRKTGEPVVSGDEAIMVGPLVLVKNPVYAPKDQFLFSESPLVNAPPNQRGMTRDAVERVVQTIKRTWTNAPAHVTVQSVSDLPKALREQAERDGVNPRGVYEPDSQVVYLIADNLANPGQAAIVLAHEALGHFGLRVVLGKNFNKMMDDLYRTNKMIRDRADEKINEGEDKRTAVEEVLAEMAEEVYDLRVPENKNKLSALQKVINAVKQFLRNLGVPVGAITDQEVIGLIANARKAVVKGPVKAAMPATEQAKYSKRAANIFNGLNQQVNNLPGMNSQLADDFKNAMSNVPDKVRSAALGFLTMPQIQEIYGTQLPSLKKLTTALEARASDMMARRQNISKNIQDWYKIANKHKAQLPRFFAIANRTTLDQIDVLDPAEANNPLTKEFEKLHPDLQKVYKQLRDDYKKSSDEYMHLLLSNLKQSQASVIRLKMEAKRLKVYLPLFRMGDYWVSFNDKNDERVSMAFESVREAKQAAEKARADGMTDVKEFTRLQQITYRTVPPTGFMGSVVKQLQDQGVQPEVIDSIYQTYLSLFPAQSVRQQFRKREGRLGFREDVFQVYANVATRMANQLANMKNAEPLEKAVTGVREEFEQNPTMELRDVVDNMQKQLDFIRNPVNGDIVNKASYFSYMWFIAGNVSSALVNLTQMPIVVYPLLGGRYGFGRAADAMRQATIQYWKGGKDDNSEFLPDWTFGAKATGELKQLYDTAVQQQAIRRSTGYEITEARKSKVEDFTGRRAQIEHGLGWIFQNSERANREITLIAAFKLAREGANGKPGMSVDGAIDYAISVVNDAHGASLAEIGPRFFQQGIGKVAFTFKRFAQAQIYLLGRLFHQAFKSADKDTRDIARKQLLGIAGTSYIFAGIQGMPLYGAVSVLANMLADDDDEPFDMDATVRAAFGDIGYKGPVNALLAVDIASRTGFNGLIWRDDPKRLAEIGPTLYAIEQAAGPAYGAFRNAERGLKLVQEGEWQRGMEALMPSFVRNGLKAFRLGTEGAMTKDGVPITDDIGAYNTFMQIFGFNPAELAEAQARAGATKRAERAIMDRRAALLEKAYLARQQGDNDGLQEIMQAIGKFNDKNPEVDIDAKTLRNSFMSRQRHIAESVDGVYLNPKLRGRLMETYGGGED